MKKKNVGPTWARWLVHWTSIRTLQVLHGKRHENKIKQNSGNSQFFPKQIQLTISIISRIGDSGCSGSHARLIKPATGGRILSGRLRTGDHPEKISEYFRISKTKEYK
jgi:hypothetical protein